jgi:isopentenyl-diphosphate delta-isomerase
MKKEFVVLVNRSGKRIGVSEKLKAHREGLLHRAFSIFIFNNHGEMLLQKRAKGKYHFAGLWSNACCSHPRAGEKVLPAAKRRLVEELNLKAPLLSQGKIIYKFFDRKSGLTEHEYDYIFTGKFNDTPQFNADEVSEVKWISMKNLKRQMKETPEIFTPWFLRIMAELPVGE